MSGHAQVRGLQRFGFNFDSQKVDQFVARALSETEVAKKWAISISHLNSELITLIGRGYQVITILEPEMAFQADIYKKIEV